MTPHVFCQTFSSSSPTHSSSFIAPCRIILFCDICPLRLIVRHVIPKASWFSPPSCCAPCSIIYGSAAPLTSRNFLFTCFRTDYIASFSGPISGSGSSFSKFHSGAFISCPTAFASFKSLQDPSARLSETCEGEHASVRFEICRFFVFFAAPFSATSRCSS